MTMMSLDFETFSEVDIKAAGAFRYARDPSTEVLIACWSTDEGKTVHNYLPFEEEPPQQFLDDINRATVIRAFNADFEEQIYKHVCIPKYNCPEIPEWKWLDTQHLTYAMALPGSLERVGAALELDVAKNPEGRALINMFSKLTRGRRTYPWQRPQAFGRFVQYCTDDVILECKIYAALPLKRLNEFETQVAAQHWRMNRQGVLLDVDSAKAIRRMLDHFHDKYLRDLQLVTRGAVEKAGSRVKFLAWAESEGYKLDSFQKFDLEQALEDPKLPDTVRRAIELRLILNQVSTKKFIKMKAVACEDNTCKGNLVYHRATTGRAGGAGLQLHNFPRNYVSRDPNEIERCIDLIKSEMYDVMMQDFSDPFTTAKGLLRPMIIAPPGKMLYVSDFSGVENRGTAWIANDPVALQVFEQKRDQYREFASQQFDISAEDVTDEQRTAAKATILGGMFSAGWKTIYNTNVQRGIPMTEEEAQRNVRDLRRLYRVTAETWYALERAAMLCVENNDTIEYKTLTFAVEDNFLLIQLPSKRCLAYYKPKYEPVELPWGDIKMGVTYMGMPSSYKWMRMSLTPSRLIENIVSGICRDLIMHASLNIEADGRATPVLTVHDEVVSYADPNIISLEEYNEMMVQLPDWAYNVEGIPFPLEAEGYAAKRYKK